MQCNPTDVHRKLSPTDTARRKSRCNLARNHFSLARRSPSAIWLWLSMAALATGCGATSARPSRPIVEFPTAEKLEELMQQPQEFNLGAQDVATGDGWRLIGPLPRRIVLPPRPAESPPELELQRLASDSGAVLAFDEALHCLAREMAQFTLERGARPEAGLQSYALGMCGSSLPGVASILIGVTLEGEVSDEEHLLRWIRGNPESIQELLSERPTRMGIALAREGADAVIAFMVGKEIATLQAMRAYRGSATEVIVQGKVLEDAAYVSAYATRGPFGTNTCQMDLTVRLPNFRAVCPVEPDDALTTIELLATPPRRVLGNIVARVLLRSDAAVEPLFQYQKFVQVTEVKTGEEFASEVITAINLMRRKAGYRPIQLAEVQTDIATRLAPHYFASMHGQNKVEVAETIAQGLLAGRQVPGMIRRGRFTSYLIVPTADINQWLTSMLASPLGRQVVLEPDGEFLALGPVVSEEGNYLAAIALGYSLYHTSQHQADVEAVFQRIVNARKQLKLPPPLIVGQLADDMTKQLEYIYKGKRSPSRALDHVLERGTIELRRSMRGYLLETIDLDEIKLPDAMLRAPQLYLQMGITHHRPEGASWAQYVVLMAYVAPGR